MRGIAARAYAGGAGAGGTGVRPRGGTRRHKPSRLYTCQAQRIQRVSAKDSHNAQASIAILYHHSETDTTPLRGSSERV